MRYSRIALWTGTAAVAIAVTTTAVGTTTGALGAGRDVLTEDGVAAALAAAPSKQDVARDQAPPDAYRDGDEKVLTTSAGDVVASCTDDKLTIHSLAPKPGYRVLMLELGRDSLRSVGSRNDKWFAMPKLTGRGGSIRVRIGSSNFAVIFDKASSEVSVRVAVSCANGEPTAKESEVVKNFGAGKG